VIANSEFHHVPLVDPFKDHSHTAAHRSDQLSIAPNRQTPEQKNQLTPKPLLTMHEIAATVTTAAPTELKLTGNWPVDWLQAPGIRSIQIQRKLLANESLGSPLVAVREEEILGNRANWPRLQLGDRVIVRCFFPDESR
jgi:hypothetical protein